VLGSLTLTDDHVFGVKLIDSIVYHMQRGKAARLDDLTVEHLQFSHPALFVLLAELFNLFMQCGYVSNDFSRSNTIPILKDGKNSLTRSLSMDDFRGITISPVISKLFESCILDRYKQYL